MGNKNSKYLTMKVLTLTPYQSSNLSEHRIYYKSELGNLFCIDVDGKWYVCSKDGEPEYAIQIVPDEEFVCMAFAIKN